MLTTSKASSYTSFTEPVNVQQESSAQRYNVLKRCRKKFHKEYREEKKQKIRLKMRIQNFWHWFPLPELRQIYWDTLEKIFFSLMNPMANQITIKTNHGNGSLVSQLPLTPQFYLGYHKSNVKYVTIMYVGNLIRNIKETNITIESELVMENNNLKCWSHFDHVIQHAVICQKYSEK